MKRLHATHPWQLVLGLSAWALWFVLVYAGVAAACETGAVPSKDAWNVPQAWLLGLSLALTAAMLWAAWACWRAARAAAAPTPRFIAAAGAALHLWAAAGMAMIALPLAWVPPCI